MNRYVIGSILASIVLLASNGLRGFANLFPSSPDQRDNVDFSDGSLGTLPIEQAGRLAQRQSQVTPGGVRTSSDSVTNPSASGQPEPFQDSFRSAPNMAPNAVNNQTPGNVIPQGGTTAQQLPASGDIAPLQPDLIRPGTQPAPDRDLDSIPALW